jgi:hypothetical protein
MSKVIQFSDLARQHQLNLLEHCRQQYQERENYLNRVRKLLFQLEAQMRQAELEQYALYQQILEDLQIEVSFPNLGDRVGLQRLFTDHPALTTLTQFLEGRLELEECYTQLQKLREEKKKS